MLSLADLPEKVPLFPLPGALLLPRARLPLNIFEPRYLALLEDTLKTSHRLIGMVQPVDAHDDQVEIPKLHSVGCAGRVTAFSETDDGRYMITLTGVARFRIAREAKGFTPYRVAEPIWSEFSGDLAREETDPSLNRESFLKTLARYFSATGLSSDWESLEKAEDELLINSLSILCPFDVEDKQALLEAQTLSARRKILTTLMEFILAGGSDEGKIQ